MISIPDGASTYLFSWRGEALPPLESRGAGQPRSFGMLFASRSQARFLLQTLQKHWEFRRLCASDPLADPVRWSADQMLDHLAQQLVTVRLRVERRWRQMPSGDSAVVERVVVPRRSVANSPAPVNDPPTFPQELDPESQAEVLAAAAESGAPFCAECMRAAQQEAAAAARSTTQSTPAQQPPPENPTFPSNSDASAQAQTLIDASDAGVPFCAECQRAAQQQAA